MIKELREKLDITLSELSFVLDVDEEKIMEWEETKSIPEEIIQKLHKRYSQFFDKNDKGQTVFKVKEEKNNNGFNSNSKLDNLFKSAVKKPKKSKKIVVRKKKGTNSEYDDNSNIKNDNTNNNTQNNGVKVKKIEDEDNNKQKSVVVIKENKSDELNIPTDYIKNLINDNKNETFSSLRDIRKYLKISQTELGEALEINQRKISIWEITNAKLPKEIIEKITEKFDISIKDIKHLIESDETNYLLDNLPISKDSIFYDKEIDSLNIQAIRKAFGHSLRSFANVIGVHYQTVARWEKGHGIPKDYVLKEIIDQFLSRKALKQLINKEIDVKLKEEYAHWDNDEEDDVIQEDISKEDVKIILDKKIELLKKIEDEGMEIDSITINSNKNVTFKNLKHNFKATFIFNEEVKEILKEVFN